MVKYTSMYVYCIVILEHNKVLCCLFSSQDEVFKNEEFLESGRKINKKERSQQMNHLDYGAVCCRLL